MEKRENVTDRVIAYMRTQILSGTWPVNSKLPSEKQLCDDLHCSRVSVRSALQYFIAIGAVKSIHGKGSYLCSADLKTLERSAEAPSYEELLDLLDLSAMVWPVVCVRASSLGNLELLNTLSGIVEQMRTLAPGQASTLGNLVFIFHQTIARSLHNQELLRLSSYVLTRLSRFPCTGNPTTIFYGSIYHHDLLLTAMQSQNPTRVHAALADYFDHVKRDFYKSPDVAPSK